MLLSLHPNDWTFLYSPSMADHPEPSGPNNYHFDFPIYNGSLPCKNDQACPSVHYLITNSPTLSKGSMLIVAGRIEITGQPQFHFETQPENTGTAPASVRLFIQRKNDNLSSDFYRWWSNPRHKVLQEGLIRFRVPLTPSNWSSVFGHKGDANQATINGFTDCLTDTAHIGFTFGGGDFFGHGVNVRGGTARFILTQFKTI